MVNKVILVGRLGKDPEQKGKVVLFSLATSKKFKVENELKELTSWHHISVFDKLGELCMNYLKKGSMAYVEGEISYYKNGEVTYTSILAREIRFLSEKRDMQSEKVDVDPIVQAMSDEIPF